jgi:AcrR family transcriptional regulator
MMMTRVKNAAATREALLRAARRRFVQDSYSDVGLRDVARDAGVDVAMVARYFGSKEDLFREVLRGSEPDWLDPALTAEELPAFLAKMAVRADEAEDRENSDRLLILLRSASSPATEALVRDSFEEDVLKPIADLLARDDAYMRASLALAILCGTTVLRTVMTVQPLQECQQCDLESNLRELLQRALLS